MITTDIIISKANAIRFAHIDGNAPNMDNTLSYNQIWLNKSTFYYDQIHFIGDNPKLIQLKAGLTATVTFTKIAEDGTVTTLTPDDTTTYAGSHIIYEYLITYATAERFSYSVTNGLTGSSLSRWDSECQRVISSEDNYLLMQWTNSDPGNDTYEFDYNTTLAIANVNYMRIKGEVMLSGYDGDTTVYGNQNETTKIKDVTIRKEKLITEVIPFSIFEIITIAMAHDAFVVNDLGYVVEDKPDLGEFGGAAELTAEMTLVSSEGLNSDDVGFTCDNSTTAMNEIIPIIFTDAVGNDSGTVTEGYAVSQVLIKVSSGTVTTAVGNTVGGGEIVRQKTGLTAAMGMISLNVVHMPTDGFDGDWPIYLTLSGGTASIWIQTTIQIQH